MTRIIADHGVPNLRDSLSTDLPFKIPILNREWVDRFPDVLTVGRTEYAECIDLFLGRVWNFPSETAVSALDQMWVTVCTNCIPGLEVLLNQHDPSSKVSLRPDTTFLMHGALVSKAEAKWLLADMQTAKKELTEKLFPGARALFPMGSDCVVGITTCSTTASMYYIMSNSNDTFTTLLHSDYSLQTNDADRVRFIADIFRVMRWIVTVQAPTQSFHLVPNVRTKTPNGHHITWGPTGLLKELRLDPECEVVERILEVYSHRLEHVEWGEKVPDIHNAIMVTRVGFKIRDSLAAGYISRDNVIAHVRLGLEELHRIGFAHCDVVVDNVFFNDGVAFLDDLEYLTPLSSPAPETSRWNKAAHPGLTAEQLDDLLFSSFVRDLHRW